MADILFRMSFMKKGLAYRNTELNPTGNSIK